MSKKYCNFCGEELIKSQTLYVCDNHLPVTVIIIDYFDKQQIYLCKNGYEIQISPEKIYFNKHEKYTPEDEDTIGAYLVAFQRESMNVDGYNYSARGKTIFSINEKYHITPENFDSYVEKFKALVLFS